MLFSVVVPNCARLVHLIVLVGLCCAFVVRIYSGPLSGIYRREYEITFRGLRAGWLPAQSRA